VVPSGVDLEAARRWVTPGLHGKGLNESSLQMEGESTLPIGASSGIGAALALLAVKRYPKRAQAA
jgi:hypothetical protein